MSYTENQLDILRDAVGKRLSEKRFAHTLGVEEMAARLARRILPEKLSEIRAAALLHDISKELDDAEHIDIMNKQIESVGDSDMLSPAVYHSLTAPYIIEKHFPDFAHKDILSAVRNHTVGSPDMSLLDEIIFISDYIEGGRKYSASVEVRDALLSVIDSEASIEECISALHDATVRSLEKTIISVIERGRFLHERTVETRNAFLGRRPVPLN